jgi:hypothetical protein
MSYLFVREIYKIHKMAQHVERDVTLSHHVLMQGPHDYENIFHA